MEAAAGASDPFDAIVMAEERFHGEGYQEGYAEGSHVGVIEGRRYGALHGAKIGSEIGYYHGFAVTWQRLLHRSAEEKPSKKTKALESLIGMIQKYPYEDPTYDKLHEDLEKIRGKFKQDEPEDGITVKRRCITDMVLKAATAQKQNIAALIDFLYYFHEL